MTIRLLHWSFVTLGLGYSTMLSAQGHWLSAYNGGCTGHYFAAADPGFHEQPALSFGMRYGRDLGPKFRFGLGFTHVRRRLHQVRNFHSALTGTTERKNEFEISEWTVSIMGCRRLAYTDRGDTRVLFGLDLVEPSNAHAKVAQPFSDGSVEFDFVAPSAFGLRAGVRHAVQLNDLFWFFGELHLVETLFARDEVSVPDSPLTVPVGQWRTSALLCIGLEIGRSEAQAQ